MADKKRDIVQTKNPRTGHYVKIDRSEWRILGYKKSEGPYKGVPIARGETRAEVIHDSPSILIGQPTLLPLRACLRVRVG